MRRRETLRGAAVRLVGQILVAVALLSLAVPAVAQDKVWRVGLLSNGAPTASPEQQSTWRSELLLSLDQNGYRLGRNLELVDRYSDGHVDRLPGLAGEIAAAGVDVVVAVSDPSVRAMLAVTQATPIVIVVGGDPVADGFVASMAHPGGRVTGLAKLACATGCWLSKVGGHARLARNQALKDYHWRWLQFRREIGCWKSL